MVNKPKALISDADGTLCLNKGTRSPYDFSKLHLDAPNNAVILVVKAIQEVYKYPLIITTGCEEKYREARAKWMTDNGIVFHEMHMRATGDRRNDSIIKAEMYRDLINPYWDIQMVFEDRDRCVAVWRGLGIPTFQVEYGAF